MIKTRGILHFTLPVSDIERSKRFFIELLGCTLIAQSPIMAFMQTGEDYFILTRSLTPINPNAGDDVRVHHAFMVDHDRYDAALETMKANGIEIIRDEYRTTGAFTGRQFYVHDPDGNAIEIIAYEGRGQGY